MDETSCCWIIRKGSIFNYWAFTSCKHFAFPNYSTYKRGISKAKDIKLYYDGRQCAICGKLIECDIKLVNE